MYSAIEHLAKTLWLGRFNWSNRMAMYSAYFDESGEPDDSRFLVVAGCVADVEQWVHFEREWKDALAPLGDNIVFHAVDFEQGNEPFHALSEREKDDLFALLVGIICRRVEKSISRVTRLEHYDAINAKYVFAEAHGFPYPSAARACMGAVSEWASKYSVPQEEMLYFFEHGAKHRGQLEWIAERDHFPDPVFRKKRDAVPLQSGDLIAWCNHLHLTKQEDGEKLPERYKRALDKLSEHSNDWGIVNYEDPDRIPTLLSIPLRDPRYRYKCQIVRHGGRRRAVIRYDLKTRRGQHKINRKTLVLPESVRLTLADVEKSIAEYESAKRKATTDSHSHHTERDATKPFQKVDSQKEKATQPKG